MFCNAVITGSGSYVPERKVPNTAFLDRSFYKRTGEPVTKSATEVVEKLREISGIRERRYIEAHHDSADLGAIAGGRAIRAAALNKERIDEVIVAHNFGNLVDGDRTSRLIPNLAALVKHKIGIKNPACTAYDILYGCPGWLLAMHQAHQAIQTGNAERVLVVGVEVISRVLDPYDMDSMLFGDGAGAVVLEAREEEEQRGLLAYQSYSHCEEEVEFLAMGPSYNRQADTGTCVKMKGKSVYRYAVNHVPDVVTACLEEVGIGLEDIAKLLIHQANEKMLLAIGEKLGRQHDLEVDLCELMPMTLSTLGNASVATIPTLIDKILRDEMPGHVLHAGDTVAMASVGAGMHANCLIYRF